MKHDSPKNATMSTGVPDKWQAEDDARSLQRAGEILGSARRLAAARKIVQAQVAGTDKLLGVMSRQKAAGSFAQR